MVTVNIHNAKGESVRFEVPEGWAELSEWEFVHLAQILFSKYDEMTIRMKAVHLLADIGWGMLTSIGEEKVQEHLLPLVDWIKEPCDLTTQIIPQMLVGEGIYYGPKDCLSNMRFSEFDAAERAFADWAEAEPPQQPPTATLSSCKDLFTPNALEKLYYFIAILYRPGKKPYDFAKDPDGDARVPFNSNSTDFFAKQMMESVSESWAYAIVLWYKACRAFMVQQFPTVFTAPASDDDNGNSEPGYYKLMRAIAKEGTYGKFEDVEQMFIYNALMEMEAAAQDRAAMEAAMEEAKSHRS